MMKRGHTDRKDQTQRGVLAPSTGENPNIKKEALMMCSKKIYQPATRKALLADS